MEKTKKLFKQVTHFIHYATVSSLNQTFFFYLDFLSQTFTIHRTAGEDGGYLYNSITLYLYNSPVPLETVSQTLRH